jgi:RND family efflux transporter MFP subunit
MAAPGIPLFTLVDLNPARVRVGIPESDIAGIRPGQRATVTVPALENREFQGTVELVGVAADPTSRTFSAKIVVPNPGNILRAGMIAEATVQGSDTVTAITLPGDAIVRDPQGATLVYVYFPDRKRVFARRVEAGTVRNRDVEIRSGLTGEELVVTAGQNRVRDGAAVEVGR